MQTIKKYYKPIQPTVSKNGGKITYEEIYPKNEIQNFVHCFWQLKTREKLSEDFNYRVVSDGCIDIFFDHQQPNESFVMGFCRKFTEFSIGKEFDYIGIRFLPTAFPLLFEINAKSLSNQAQDLKNIKPDISKWISSEIKPGSSFEQISKILNEKLIEIINDSNIALDQRFLNSLILIFEKKGFLDTEKDLVTGLSPRQLRRIFDYYIGTTAKSFSNVVRFQHILNAKPSKLSLKNNKLYFDVGFFDQAHFIKNFKTFYGVTPSEAFR